MIKIRRIIVSLYLIEQDFQQLVRLRTFPRSPTIYIFLGHTKYKIDRREHPLQIFFCDEQTLQILPPAGDECFLRADGLRPEGSQKGGKFLMIYICNSHVLSHLLLICICKLHWNLNTMFVCQVISF